MNEIGPLAIPPQPPAISESFSLKFPKLAPTPPPYLDMTAAFFKLSNIPSIESGTLRVKQANII